MLTWYKLTYIDDKEYLSVKNEIYTYRAGSLLAAFLSVDWIGLGFIPPAAVCWNSRKAWIYARGWQKCARRPMPRIILFWIPFCGNKCLAVSSYHRLWQKKRNPLSTSFVWGKSCLRCRIPSAVTVWVKLRRESGESQKCRAA